jgi:RNA 3'-terminal phosphate cyclase-like protein
MVAPPVLYNGHVDFRMRLVLATLSGRAIKIDRIRSDDMEPGLKGILNIVTILHVNIR